MAVHVIEFGILGPLEAGRAGQQLQLGGRNQRAVLALLLLNANRVVSIERLAEDLYGGEAPVSAVTQVHRQVSELRKLLDADAGGHDSVIETRSPGYLVRVDHEGFDLHRFEGLTGRPRWPHPRPRRTCSARRSRCGEERPSPTSPTSRSRWPRSRGSTSCAWRRSSAA